MPDTNAPAPAPEIQGDGSMMDAINSMPDIEALEIERAPRPVARDNTGKYQPEAPAKPTH